MSIKEYFSENKYVYLENVLSPEECKKLTSRLFKLKDEGKLTKDTQCPLSWSIYGDEELDKILERLRIPLSQQLEIDLLPTYTYARIYQPGEVLKHHIDRESCEISGTLTLGHDPNSEIWPIFFAEDPKDKAGTAVKIDVGDLLMYKGNELYHWRPEYIGQWQVQVFFHYVDANGKNKEWAYDKRSQPTLEKKHSIIDKYMPNIQNNNSLYNNVMILTGGDGILPGYCSYNSKFRPEFTFSKKECEKIIEYAKNKYPKKGKVGTGKVGNYKEEVRRVDQYVIDVLPETKWIYDRIVSAISTANREYFKFELIGITHGIQLLHYKSTEEGFYDWHVDIGNGETSTRKISASIMLSDENDYEGGELLINGSGKVINSCKEQGSINMFPSYELHTVTPVTKGDRWVMVIWIHGSQRFR